MSIGNFPFSFSTSTFTIGIVAPRVSPLDKWFSGLVGLMDDPCIIFTSKETPYFNKWQNGLGSGKMSASGKN